MDSKSHCHASIVAKFKEIAPVVGVFNAALLAVVESDASVTIKIGAVFLQIRQVLALAGGSPGLIHSFVCSYGA